MNGSDARQNKAEVNAISVQSTLLKRGPLTFEGLVERTGLTPQQTRQGLRCSRRTNDDAKMANQIVCTAEVDGEHVYFVGTSDESRSYMSLRNKVACGHMESMIILAEKAEEKWPAPERRAAIKMMEMARELLVTL